MVRMNWILLVDYKKIRSDIGYFIGSKSFEFLTLKILIFKVFRYENFFDWAKKLVILGCGFWGLRVRGW